MLREAGLEVGPGRVADALRGLDHVDITRQEDVYWALRTTFVARREDLETFDRAFDAWFLRRAGRLARAARSTRARCTRRARGSAATRDGPRGGARRGRAGRHRAQRPRGAAREGLRVDDAGGVRRGARGSSPTLAVRRPTRRSHRLRRDRRGRILDMRALARDAIATGGDPIRRSYRRRAETPRKLVVLCDVSGSMEAYSRALLLYLHAILRLGRGVEVFAFGTRLTRLTRELQTRDPDLALERARAPRRRLGGGHPDRRVAEGVQRRLGAARPDARRDRPHRLRRVGARRPRARRPRDGAPAPGGVRGRLGEPGEGQPRLPAAGRRGCARRCRPSTGSSRATTSRASRRWESSWSGSSDATTADAAHVLRSRPGERYR